MLVGDHDTCRFFSPSASDVPNPGTKLLFSQASPGAAADSKSSCWCCAGGFLRMGPLDIALPNAVVVLQAAGACMHSDDSLVAATAAVDSEEDFDLSLHPPTSGAE
jgi:hypothetical protein